MIRQPRRVPFGLLCAVVALEALLAISGCVGASARADDERTHQSTPSPQARVADERPAERPGSDDNDGPVFDDAGIIGGDDLQRIEQRLADIERASSVQIVVATVDSLRDVSIEAYARRTFAWHGIGRGDVNNGLLIVIAPNDRRVRVEVGLGMEWEVSDGLAADAIDAMLPALRNGAYGSAVDAALDVLEPAATRRAWTVELRDVASIARNATSVGRVARLEGMLTALDDTTAAMRVAGVDVALVLPPHWHGIDHELTIGDSVRAHARVRAPAPLTLELLSMKDIHQEPND